MDTAYFCWWCEKGTTSTARILLTSANATLSTMRHATNKDPTGRTWTAAGVEA